MVWRGFVVSVSDIKVSVSDIKTVVLVIVAAAR